MNKVDLLILAIKGLGMEDEDVRSGYEAGKEYFMTTIQGKTTGYKLGAASAILEFLDTEFQEE